MTGDDLWDPGMLRLFVSHISRDKTFAAELARHLRYRGVSFFVAHEDIEPSREWQQEILRALRSADAIVALMTNGFSESSWTDQEVGFALGRGLPWISVRLGADPYGFIGHVQAVPGHRDDAGLTASGIFDALRKADTLEAKWADAFIAAVREAPNFRTANELGRDVLRSFTGWTEEQVRRLVSTAARNRQVVDSNDGRPTIEQIALDVLGERVNLEDVLKAELSADTSFDF